MTFNLKLKYLRYQKENCTGDLKLKEETSLKMLLQKLRQERTKALYSLLHYITKRKLKVNLKDY